MKIGVISDTHIRNNKEELPAEISDIFANVNLIFHAGDICIWKVISDLEKIAPVIAVPGNMDPPVVYKKLSSFKKIELENKKILIVHGQNGPGKVIKNIKKINTDADCIIFGHSHQPYNQKHEGKLLFNPGSPTKYKRSNIKKKKPSVGILEIEQDRLEGKIIYY